MNYKFLVPISRDMPANPNNKGCIVFGTVTAYFQPYFFNQDGTTFVGPNLSITNGTSPVARQKPVEFPIRIAGFTGSNGNTAYLVY